MAAANDIAHALFGHSLDDLSRPSRQLLELIFLEHVQRQARERKTEHVSFTRRDLREAFKWGDTRLRTHLDELVQMEYLLPLSGRFGQTFLEYRLLYDPAQEEESGRFLAGLKSVEQLRKEASLAGVLPNLAPQNGHLAPTSQVESARFKAAKTRMNQGRKTASARNLAP